MEHAQHCKACFPDVLHHLHAFFPISVAVKTDSPWTTFNELIDYAKKNPGKLRVSTAGVGTTSNFDVQIVQSLTGAQFTLVPFKGGEAVVTALLGGHVEVSFDIVGKFAPRVMQETSAALVPEVPSSKVPTIRSWAISGSAHGLFGMSGPRVCQRK
jgi:tripartite-type tricarboxylate transporter receptor subunit TctC